MEKRRVALILAVALLLPFSGLVLSCCDGESVIPEHIQTHNIVGGVNLGGHFTKNQGQLDEGIHYYAIGNPSVAFFDDGIMFVLKEPLRAEGMEVAEGTGSLVLQESPARSHAYFLRFEGASATTPMGMRELSFRSNYFIGNDPSHWAKGVPSYREVVYQDLYDGIDLTYVIRGQQLKYEFTVNPGADLDQIALTLEGIDPLAIDVGGNLVIHTSLGEVVDSVPHSYTDRGIEVPCDFVLRGHQSYGFSCSDFDTTRPLTIDPLVYATFLGGSVGEQTASIAVDLAGNAYVTGEARSADFPTTPGAFDTTLNWTDVYVVKLDGDGSDLVYATFIGGSGSDSGKSIDVDLAGNAYVTGYARSADFPVTPGAFDTSYNGTDVIADAFVTKLNATGSGLLYSTFLGADGGWDYGSSVDVDWLGNAYVTGYTDSDNFPTTPGAFDTTHNGSRDAFAVKLNPTGTAMLYSSFLGGSGHDMAYSIVADTSGNAYAVGRTYSDDFPVTPGAFDPTFNGPIFGLDSFLVKVNTDGSALEYATYLGGGGDDYCVSVDVDAFGRAYVAGSTSSTDFPTTADAFDTTHNGGTYDAFVARFAADGGSLEYSTFLGGGSLEYGSSIAVDMLGNAYLTGATLSTDFPTTLEAFDDSYNGERDAFVAKLSNSGRTLLYGTFLGGSLACDWDVGDGGDSIDVDFAGNAYVAGWTCASDFPVTPGAFDTTHNGLQDNFVAKLDMGSVGSLSPEIEQAFLSGRGLENVTLAWNPSPEEAFGLVDRYDILRGEDFNTSANLYTNIGSVPNGTHQFVDAFAGEGNPNTYFYAICAINMTNDSTCAENQAGKFTRPLTPGPNLVSVPLIQSNVSIETVLQTVEYDKAWFYDSSSQEWKWHMISKGYRRGLWSVNHTMGLWVNVTGDCNLTVAGIVPAQTIIHLYEGWNLVSFPSFNATYTIADLKVEIGVTRVEGMETMPPFPPSRLRVLADLDALQAGWGYWVRVEADADWTVEVS